MQKRQSTVPTRGAAELGRNYAKQQGMPKRVATSGLRRAVSLKNAQATARKSALDDLRKLADVSLLDTSVQTPHKTMPEPSPPTSYKIPIELPTPLSRTESPLKTFPQKDHYSIVLSTTPVKEMRSEEESEEESPPTHQVERSHIEQDLKELGVWEDEAPSDDNWTDMDSESGRPSILPPMGGRTGVCKDLASERAREYLHIAKEALENVKRPKREMRAIGVECLSNMYELVLSLADSRNRHRLNLEEERTRAAKELVRLERAHNKELVEQRKEFDKRLKEVQEELKGTHKAVNGVQSWLNFEMEDLLKSVRSIHQKNQSAQETPKPSQGTPTAPSHISCPHEDHGPTLKIIKQQLGDLSTELHYLKQDAATGESRLTERACSLSPKTSSKPEESSPNTDDLKAELRRLQEGIEEIKTLLHTPQAATKTDLKEEIQAATTPIVTKTREILEEIKEVKDVAYTSGGPQPTGAMGLAAEMAITDTATQIESILNPLRADVSEVASQSKALNKTLTWINSSFKSKAPTAISAPPAAAKITYAAAASNTVPKPRPSHSLIVSSTDPTKTGDNVIEAIRGTVDFKSTGVTVDRVRKAKNRKVVLSFEREEDAKRLQDNIHSNKTLQVKQALTSNPQVIVKNILNYHSDEDIIDHIRAQNKKLFTDLRAEDKSIRVRYRKRTRNELQCHAVLEVSPQLHRRMLEGGTVHIGLQKRPVEDQSPLVQCAKCLGFGHTKTLCKERDQLCNYCGEQHSWQDCPSRSSGDPPQCKNCVRAKENTTAAPHVAFSPTCPQWQIWDNIARSRIAYC